VNPLEFTFGLVMVLLLVALAGFFAWRQRQTLQALRRQTELDLDERRYLQAQAMRRLLCSGLMLLLAGLLIGSWFFEPGYQEVTQSGRTAAANAQPNLKPEERDFLQNFTFYWILILLVLFVFAVVATLDIRATLRYGLDRHRQLEQDHRAALEAHVRQLRERNGRKPHK
jgi:hypothetical protein